MTTITQLFAQAATADLPGDAFVHLRDEAHALADLFTPQGLLFALVVVLLGWLAVSLVDRAVVLVQRFSAEPRRRLALATPLARLVAFGAISYLLLVRAFRAAPVLTVAIVALASLSVLLVFSAQLRSAYVGLVLSSQGRIRIGDRVEVGPHSGIVRRFGVLRIELRQHDESTLYVPNRLLEDEIVKVEAAKSSVTVRATSPLTGTPTPELLASLRRHAMMCPYRLPGSPVHVSADGRERTATAEVQVWGTVAARAATTQLELALRETATSAPREAATTPE